MLAPDKWLIFHIICFLGTETIILGYCHTVSNNTWGRLRKQAVCSYICLFPAKAPLVLVVSTFCPLAATLLPVVFGKDATDFQARVRHNLLWGSPVAEDVWRVLIGGLSCTTSNTSSSSPILRLARPTSACSTRVPVYLGSPISITSR
jgi:hypothetical protein